MSRPLLIENRRARRYWSAGRVARAVTMALALVGASSALADEPARSEKPEEIIIQGKENKNVYNPDTLSLDRLKSVKKTQSVSVVPQILIEQQGATTLKDALRNVSGIGLNAGEGGVQGDDFTLRGYSAKTDIFIDGVRDQGSYQRDSFNLQSVEVVKGPSSSYFGRGSTGGAVNQVSKTARAGSSYAGIVSSGMGPFNRASFDVNQQLSESVAFRANVMGQNAELVDRDGSEVRRFGYATSLVVGLDQPTKLTLNYLFQKDNNVPDYGLPYIGGEPARLDRDVFFGSGAQRDFEKVAVNVATAQLEHTFNDDVKIRNTTRFSHVDRAAAPTGPRECLALTNVPAANVAATMGMAAVTGLTNGCAREEVASVNGQRRFNQIAGIRRGRPERDARETILSNQTDLSVNFTTGALEHSVATGFEVAREEFRLTRFSNDGPATIGFDPDSVAANSFGGSGTTPLSFVSPRVRSQRTNTRALSLGLFVADEIKLNEYVDLIAGVRADYFRASFNDDFPTASTSDDPRLTNPDFTSTDRKLSYKAGIAFHPTENQNYYISYGTSFNPSAEALSLSAGTEDAEPEKNRVYEIGGSINLRDGALNLQGAIFNIEKTDAREQVDAGGLQLLEGKRITRGFEIAAQGKVTEGWSVVSTYTFLDSETDATAARNRNSKHEQIQRVPRHSATLWNSYQFPGGKFEIAGGPSYVSHRYSDANNTNKVKGYTRWDASLGYAINEKVTLRLNLQNLADKEYFEAAGGGHAVPAPGRTAIATVSFNF